MDLGHGDRWRLDPPDPARPQQPIPPLRPPGDLADLEAWFTATLRDTPSASKAAVLAAAESAAGRRFPARDVTAAMCRALSHELTRGVLIRHERP